MKQTRKDGFTLLELLVVVIIVGILASVALPQFAKMIKRSRVTESESQVGAIATAELVYYQEKGIFTSIGTDLVANIPGTDVTGFNYTLAASGSTTATITATGRTGTPTEGITTVGTVSNNGTRTIKSTGI